MPYKDPTKKREWARRYNRELQLKRRDAIRYLKDKPCEDCGNVYPACVMDFHHRDPAQKGGSIHDMRSRSMEAIKAEVDKCDLLCANCHRIRHHKGD